MTSPSTTKARPRIAHHAVMAVGATGWVTGWADHTVQPYQTHHSKLSTILDGIVPDSETTLILPLGEHADLWLLDLDAAGWTVHGSRIDRPSWLTAVDKDRNRTVYLGFRAELGDDPLLGNDTLTPYEITRLLWEWLGATNSHYRYTPGVSLLAAMRNRAGHAGRPHWVLSERGPGGAAQQWTPPAMINDLRYAPDGRTPRAAKTAQATWHRWDMRRAYLNAAAQCELPTVKPEPSGADPAGVGYIRIRWETVDPGARLFLPRPDRQGTVWVGHNMLDVLREIPATAGPEVVESVTTTQHVRHLRPWGETIRDALTNSSPTIEPVLKNGYASAIGLLNVNRGSVYRPDWRHMIIDYTAASMMRRILRVHRLMEGLLPSKVDVDSIWYDTDDPDHVGKALGEGPRIGNLRYEGQGS